MITNNHDVGGYADWEKGSFDYNWLGATVKFKLLGHRKVGRVRSLDKCYHTLSVECVDGAKTVVVTGHYNCFRRL